MSTQGSLNGRVILVTGASSGIGRHFCLTLAAEGARVIAAARREALLDSLVTQGMGHLGQIFPYRMDVCSIDSIQSVLAAVESAIGPVEVLVNNAGIAHQSRALDVTEADLDRLFATNVKGPFFLAQACAAAMIRRKIEGQIVNIASVAALVTMPQLSAYGMTKAAVVHMTKSLAHEWARHGINVNAICPGYIGTELNRGYFESEAGMKMTASLPKRRIGSPADLDGALLLLASRERAGIITGAIITADDGYSVS